MGRTKLLSSSSLFLFYKKFCVYRGCVERNSSMNLNRCTSSLSDENAIFKGFFLSHPHSHTKSTTQAQQYSFKIECPLLARKLNQISRYLPHTFLQDDRKQSNANTFARHRDHLNEMPTPLEVMTQHYGSRIANHGCTYADYNSCRNTKYTMKIHRNA